MLTYDSEGRSYVICNRRFVRVQLSGEILKNIIWAVRDHLNRLNYNALSSLQIDTLLSFVFTQSKCV